MDTIKDIEKHRALWADVAKKNDWYTEPFYVQLFIDPKTGEVYDSVSFGGMTQDIMYYEPKGCGDVDCPCFDGEQCYDDWKEELMTNPLVDRLRYHVTGAIERGEKEPIYEVTE